jgi:hypothetical protein
LDLQQMEKELRWMCGEGPRLYMDWKLVLALKNTSFQRSLRIRVVPSLLLDRFVCNWKVRIEFHSGVGFMFGENWSCYHVKIIPCHVRFRTADWAKDWEHEIETLSNKVNWMAADLCFTVKFDCDISELFTAWLAGTMIWSVVLEQGNPFDISWLEGFRCQHMHWNGERNKSKGSRRSSLPGRASAWFLARPSQLSCAAKLNSLTHNVFSASKPEIEVFGMGSTTQTLL